MKIKKEYLIFGGVIVVLIGLVTLPKLLKSDVKYDKDKVTISYDSTEGEGVVPDTEEDLVDEEDTDVVDEDADAVEDDTDTVDTATDATDEEVIDTEVTDEPETTDEPEVDDTEYLYTDSEPEFNSTLTDDSIMSVVRFYVCNLLADDMFNTMATEELMNDRPNRIASEPYKSLDGVTSLESLTKDGDIVSLGTKDGNVYKFKCVFTEDGSRISDIICEEQ